MKLLVLTRVHAQTPERNRLQPGLAEALGVFQILQAQLVQGTPTGPHAGQLPYAPAGVVAFPITGTVARNQMRVTPMLVPYSVMVRVAPPIRIPFRQITEIPAQNQTHVIPPLAPMTALVPATLQRPRLRLQIMETPVQSQMPVIPRAARMTVVEAVLLQHPQTRPLITGTVARSQTHATPM